MADPVATAADVRLEIDTYLDDPTITDLITRFSRDIYRVYTVDDFEGTEHRSDFEALYTALQIVVRHDRAESSATSGRTSVEYEQSLIDALREEASDLEPEDELVGGAVIRNTARHVRQVTSEEVEID